MIRLAENWEEFSCNCKLRGDKGEIGLPCNHPKAINPICLEKKYCPRVESVAKKLVERPEWWDSYPAYCIIHEEQFQKLCVSTAWIKEMEELYPDIDILKSLNKAREYWLRDPQENPVYNGWKKCKDRRSKTLNFKETYKRALGQKYNQVKKGVSKGRWVE